MFIPFVSKQRRRSSSSGHGGSSNSGRGGSNSNGRGSSSGSRGSSSSSARSVSLPRSVSGHTTTTAYGLGGGPVVKIPQGQIFAGRTEGGATREEVYGTRTYGSGYPGTIASRGVAEHNFPYYYWPMVWWGYPYYGDGYLYDTPEYGNATNSSRPGGALTMVPFTLVDGNTTLRLIADNTTTTVLAELVGGNCSSLLSTNWSAVDVDDLGTSTGASPEQAVQYYRASSVVLTLDGYNNTDALQANASTDVPIPGWVNQTMLQCVNETIGAAVPLIDNGVGLRPSDMGFVFLAWAVGYLIHAAF